MRTESNAQSHRSTGVINHATHHFDQILEKKIYVDLLRRFRNATFHYQADPLTDKLIDFLDKKDSEVWIKDLNIKLSDFFMQALPIKETLKKLEKEGVAQIPSGSKLHVLMQAGKL